MQRFLRRGTMGGLVALQKQPASGGVEEGTCGGERMHDLACTPRATRLLSLLLVAFLVLGLGSVSAGEDEPAPTAVADGSDGSDAVMESAQIPEYVTFSAPGLRAVSDATGPVWRTYKNYNAWWGENRDQATLMALGKVWGVNYFVHPMADLQSGIPDGTDVVLITSNSMGYSGPSRANRDAERHPAAQAALIAFLEQGGKVIIDMADNDYPSGYLAPGSVGTPWLYTPDMVKIMPSPMREVTLDPSAVATGHPFTRGLTNDTIDMDGGNWVAHGNLAMGFEMPPDATILMTATYFGEQEPVLAEYPFGEGLVVVDTLTKEYVGHAPYGYSDSYIMARLFCYVDDLAGREPPIATAHGPFGPIPVGWTTWLSGSGSDPDTTGSMLYEWSAAMGTTTGNESNSVWLYDPPDEAGIYEVTLTVTDMCGFTASDSSYVVVFDPAAGHVTGGGSIDSPAGAYRADPALVGRASFGFVSRYHKGASVPEGQTEFRFNAGDLNFHSWEQNWLVMTGSNYAMFKGTGHINNDWDHTYQFRIWAGDGTGPGGADTFRIRIWSETGGVESVVYDNGMDQPITGGNIVVHTGR